MLDNSGKQSQQKTTAVRGFQINSVLDRLVWDMLDLLAHHLEKPSLDRDRLQIGVLLVLSRTTFVRSLLFRDYNADHHDQWHVIALPDGSEERVHEQALVYFEKALSRRPALARRLMDVPGNMHQLYAALCRHGTPHDIFANVLVERSMEAGQNAPADAGAISLVLARFRREISDKINDISLQRRSQYGPIWLQGGHLTLELPEEMSLFEMLEALPMPVGTDAVSDANVQKLLARVMDTLNERYTLLRSCGLDPIDWHDRDEPAIGRLRDLKRLRSEAEARLRHDVDQRVAAYRMAYDDLADPKGHFAGSRSFNEWSSTEWGQIMLRQPTAALDAQLGEGDGDAVIDRLADESSDVAGEVERRVDAGSMVAALMERRPNLFDPITAHVFLEIVGKGRAFFGEGDDVGVLRDEKLVDLVKNNPELAELYPEELAARLFERCETLIKKGMAGCRAA